MELKIYDEQCKLDLYNELKRRRLPYKVKIAPIFQNRTPTQNKYYWSVVVRGLSEELGYYPHEIHQLLLSMFAMLEEKIDEYGKAYIVVESTANMDSVRMEIYLDDIRNFFLADFNIYIPMPGEVIIEEVTEKIIYK
jgi:hypothetical protein